MNFISNLKIGARLGLAFGLTLCLILAVAGVGLNSIANADRLLTSIIEDDLKKLTFANSLAEEVHIVSRVMRTVLLLDDPAAKATEVKKIDAARTAYNTSREALKKLPASEADTALLAKIDDIATEARTIKTTSSSWRKTTKTMRPWPCCSSNLPPK